MNKMHRQSSYNHQYSQNVTSNFLPNNFSQPQQMQQIGQHAAYSYSQNNPSSVVSNQATGFKQIVQNPTSSNQSAHPTMPQTLSASQSKQWQQIQQMQNQVQQIHQQQKSGNFRPVAVTSLPSAASGIMNGVTTLQNQRISPQPHQNFSILPKQHQGVILSRSMSVNQAVPALNVTSTGQLASGGLPTRTTMQQRMSPHMQAATLTNKNISAHTYGNSRSNSTGDIGSLQASNTLLNGANLVQKLASVSQSSFSQLPHQNPASNQVI